MALFELPAEEQNFDSLLQPFMMARSAMRMLVSLTASLPRCQAEVRSGLGCNVITNLKQQLRNTFRTSTRVTTE